MNIQARVEKWRHLAAIRRSSWAWVLIPTYCLALLASVFIVLVVIEVKNLYILVIIFIEQFLSYPRQLKLTAKQFENRGLALLR